MNLEIIEKSLKNEVGVLLYFWGEHCAVCHDLEPKLYKSFEENFPKIKFISVNATNQTNIAAKFSVFAIPTAIIFLQGKEFARVGRNVSILALIKQIKRPYDILKE